MSKKAAEIDKPGSLVWPSPERLGMGLRPHHYGDLIASPTLPLLEFLADNYLFHQGGPALWHADRLSERAPARVLHAVGLDVAGIDPLDDDYIKALRQFAHRIGASVVSDHLCVTRAAQIPTYDLLPFPYSRQALTRVAARVAHIQDGLGMPLALENLSAYGAFAGDGMTEADFMAELCRQAGARILCDVNNLYVTGMNLGLDPMQELAKLPPDAIAQIHVSGHAAADGFLHDTHDRDACPEVWQLFAAAIARAPHVPVIIERDEPNVCLSTLHREIMHAQQYLPSPSSPASR